MRHLGITCALVVGAFAPAATAGLVITTFIGPDGGAWGTATNWDPDTVPDNDRDTQFDVRIDDDPKLDRTVVLDVNATVDAVRIDEGDVLLLSISNRTLALAGGTLELDGELILMDTASGLVSLRFDAPTALDGTGVLRFGSNDDNRVVSADADAIVTIGPDVLLTTSEDSLLGNSMLGAAAVNHGIIEARVGELELNDFDKVNSGLIRAVDGGTLEIEGITVSGTGEIRAETGSMVLLDAAVLSGAALGGEGVFDVTTADATLDGTVDPVTIAAPTTVEANLSGERIAVLGTIVNDGTIRLEDVGGSVCLLELQSDVTMTGSGTVLLAGNDDSRVVSTDPTFLLTLGADLSLRTGPETQLNSAMVSAATRVLGLLEADTGDLELNVNDKINEGSIRAVNGAVLEIEQVTTHNESGLIEIDDGSVLLLDGGTVVGGSLTGAGTIQVTTADGTLDGATAGPVSIGADLTAEATSSGQSIRVLGTVVNDGLIRILDAGGSIATLEIIGDTLLDGSGVVRLEGAKDSRIVSSAAELVLTIGPEQVVSTSTDTTLNNAQIEAACFNLGLIEADGGALELRIHDKINAATVRAVNGGVLEVEGIVLDNVDGEVVADDDSTLVLDACTIVGGLLTGGGEADVTGGDARLDGVVIDAGFTVRTDTTGERLTLAGAGANHGVIEIADDGGGTSTLEFDAAGETYTLTGSGVVRFGGDEDDNDLIGVDGSSLLIDAEQTILADAGRIGRIRVDATNTGTLRADGEIRVQLSTFTNATGGTVAGDGLVVINNNGALVNDGGTIAPGASAGVLTVDGSPDLEPAGTLLIEVGGTVPGTDHDRLDALGPLSLGGRLEVELLGEFEPEIGDSFVVVTGDPISGFFDCSTLPTLASGFWQVAVSPESVTLFITETPGPSADLNGDGLVNGADLGLLLGAWGPCTAVDCCFGDLSGDGMIDGADLGILLAEWSLPG